NLAMSDVQVLAHTLEDFFATGEETRLDTYGPTALRRVWRAQHFSYWMTSMLHTDPGAGAFGLQRQRGELDSITSSRAGSTYLAEAYTGWPLSPEPDHPASRPTACACLCPRTPLQEAPCEHDRPPHRVGHTPVLDRRRPRRLRHGGVGHHPPHASRREPMGS